MRLGIDISESPGYLSPVDLIVGGTVGSIHSVCGLHRKDRQTCGEYGGQLYEIVGNHLALDDVWMHPQTFKKMQEILNK
jgi:hypothetical protein